MHATHLSDEEIVSQLASLCLEGRRLVARVIVHLIEAEDRGLHVKSACDSMWAFCTQRLGMSHGETSRRLNAAKLVRRFPSLLGRIERGEIHLSSLKILGKHLDASNVEELLDTAKGKSKMEVMELVAQHFPRPAVPERVVAQSAPAEIAGSGPPQVSLLGASDRPSPAGASRIEPLSSTSYLVQMTMSKEGWDDLQRVKELMGHRIPSGNTVEVVEAALRAMRERLEKELRGKTSRPQSKRRSSKRGRIARATRREVFERDGEQCTFVDAHGNRCQSRRRLELDHVIPRGRGGSDDASNLRVACRAHNSHYAEEIYGKELVASRIQARQRLSREAAAARVAPVALLSPATATAMAEPSPASDETLECATKGLVNMWFAKPDVKRVLDAIGAKRRGEALRVEALVREAIGALT